MARGTRAAPPADPPEQPAPPEQVPGLDNFGVLQDVLAELGDGEAIVKILRRNPQNNNLRYLRQMTVTPDFGEQVLQDEFGGGVYTLQFWAPDPSTGRRIHVRTMKLELEGPQRPLTLPAVHAEPAAAAPANGAQVSDVVQMRIELARLQGMIEGMKEAGATGAAKQVDPLEMMERLSTIMRNTAPAAAPGNPSEILAFAREAVGFAKEMAPEPGGAGGEGPWEKLIDKVGAPAIDLIRQGLAQRATGPVAAPTDTPAASALPPGGAVDGTATQWLALAPHMRQLVKRAEQGRDPELAADGLLEELEHNHPQLYAEIAQLATAPDFVAVAMQRVALLEPRVQSDANIRSWVERFALAVAASFANDAPGATSASAEVEGAPE